MLSRRACRFIAGIGGALQPGGVLNPFACEIVTVRSPGLSVEEAIVVGVVGFVVVLVASLSSEVFLSFLVKPHKISSSRN